MFILLILVCFIQCSKQYTYCIFRSEWYIMKKNKDVSIFYKYDKSLQLKNNVDSMNLLKNQGYTLDTYYYDYECYRCTDAQKTLTESNNGYCISN